MPKITIVTEYEKGDIFQMDREVQKELIKQHITPFMASKAKEQLMPWDYLCSRVDAKLCREPFDWKEL